MRIVNIHKYFLSARRMKPCISLSDFSQHFSGMLSVFPNIKSITSSASAFAYSIFNCFLLGVVQNLTSARMHKVIKIHTALT